MTTPNTKSLGAYKLVTQFTPKKISKLVLTDYCDSDWSGNVDGKKSTSDYVLNVG